MSPVEVQVSNDLLRGQAVWLQQTWEAWCVAEVLLEEVTVSPTTELPQTTHKLEHNYTREVLALLQTF